MFLKGNFVNDEKFLNNEVKNCLFVFLFDLCLEL